MIKNEIIPLLEEHQGSTISGEEIAKALNITRAAVWKGIKELQKDGYIIESIPSKGYCLTLDNDILSITSIKKYLRNYDSYHIEIHKEVTSTNDIAKERALNHAKEATIIFSESQTKGKGRKGRNFYSPIQKGLYMSIVLRPICPIHHSLLITAAAAVSVYDAIQEVCGIKADIKWVNDVLINDKKICGILCEGSMETDADAFDWVVLGIGINCTKTAIPPELENIIGCLQEYCEKPISRAKLAASVWNHFMYYYKNLSKREYLHTYRSASSLLDKQITVYEGNRVMQGQAIAIDDNANLVVKTKDGVKEVFSGEVSVRKA